MGSAWFVLAAILALFAAVDVLGHKKWKLKRGLGQWCLLVGLAAGTVACAAGGFAGLADTGARDRLALGYRYLQDEDTAAARAKAQSGSGAQSKLLQLLADALDRDYLSAFLGSQQLLEDGGLKKEDADRARKVQALSAEALGLGTGGEDGAPSAEQLAQYCAAGGTDAASDTQQSTGEEARHNAVLAVVQDACADKAADGSDGRFEQIYTIDRALSTGELDGLTASDVEQLLKSYSKDADALLLATKFYVRTSDLASARKAAKRLLELYPTAENMVVYTDLIAQQALTEPQSSAEIGDPEVRGLLERAEKLEQRAAAIDTSTDKGAERAEALKNSAQDLRTQASRVDISRAVNYLLAKKPMLRDSTGLYDLQLAKLYVALDKRDTAQKYIWNVIDNAGSLASGSPLRQPLAAVQQAEKRMQAGGGSTELTGAVRELIDVQSSGVVPMEDGSVNDTLSNYVASTLKYDRLMVLIGSIDTSNYPTVRAYVNVSGEKDKAFGLAGDFGKSDFALTDTQYEIKDFRLVDDAAAKNVSIALVIDTSGSMAGTPLEDACLAAEACVNRMDTSTQRMALVTYSSSASLQVPLTDSASLLTGSIRSLSGDGGTYISGGIREGLGALSGTPGTRAIILLTDGQDNDTSEIEDAISEANSSGVAIFTVGLGEVDEAYLRNIAESTGGQFIQAANSTELSDIYLLLQKYIVNNYCMEYTVTGNPDTDPRSLTVAIPAYSTDDTMAYRISGEPLDDTETDTGIYPVDADTLAVYSLSPAGLSAGDLGRGVKVTFKGSGFQNGMNLSVGDLAVTDLKVSGIDTATGTLRGTLSAGAYDVTAHTGDGRVATLKKGLRVFSTGTVSTVKIGDLTIFADSIGAAEQADDGSVTSLAAVGNVSINGFLHSTGELTIVPQSPLAADQLKSGSKNVLYLGSSGIISGDGKLYVSYAQAQKTAESDLGGAGDAFTDAMFGGRDLVIRSGAYTLTASDGSSEFGSDYSYALSEDVADYTINLPGLSKVFSNTVKLYPDRLQLDSDLLNIDDIEDNLISMCTGGVNATKKDREAKKKEWGFNEGKIKGNFRQGKPGVKSYKLDGKLSVAIGAEHVYAGGEAELEIESTKKFFMFPIRGFSLKLNTLDENREYWSAGVTFLAPGVPVTQQDTDNNLTVTVGSYLWYPDSLSVEREMDPGIKIFKVMNLTKAGLGFSGGSGLWVDSGTPKKDFSIIATAEADLNIFKILGLPQTGAARSITRWGELGKFSDAKAVINFTRLSIDISTDLELLQQKVASAELGLSTQKFFVRGTVGSTLSAAGIELSGNLNLDLNVTWAGENQDGVSTLLALSGDASAKCAWAHFDESGNSRLQFTADAGGSNGMVLRVDFSVNDKTAAAWYDSNGRCLWDRFHAESTF